VLLDMNKKKALIAAQSRRLSFEWTVALFLPIFGEKNYYYECDGLGRWVYYPYYLGLMH
jgi:hypothetical protein